MIITIIITIMVITTKFHKIDTVKLKEYPTCITAPSKHIIAITTDNNQEIQI
jgi:hypothetical protein